MAQEKEPQPYLSITELRGLGAEIWHGVDAQEYVNQLRDEWERPVGYPITESPEALEWSHAASAHNRNVVVTSTECGCFYCLRRFAPNEILEWVDESDGVGTTALCPRCGIDAVLGDASGIALTDTFLLAMRHHWF